MNVRGQLAIVVLEADPRFRQAAHVGDRLQVREAVARVARDAGMTPHEIRLALIIKTACGPCLGLNVDEAALREQPGVFVESLFIRVANVLEATRRFERRHGPFRRLSEENASGTWQ